MLLVDRCGSMNYVRGSLAGGVLALASACGGDSASAPDLDGGSDVEESGGAAWLVQAGGIQNDRGWGIAQSGTHGLAVSGYFAGEATFGGTGSDVVQVTSLGNSDGFGMRLDGDGRLEWVRRGGGESALRSDDVTHGAAVLDGGDVVFSGGFAGAATFESTGGTAVMLESAGQWDAFLVRYDSAGQALWARTTKGVDNDEWAIDVVETSGGSLAVVGLYGSTNATFGEGEANETTLSPSGLGEAFVALYDPAGTLEWVRSSVGDAGTFTYASGLSSTSDGLAVCGTFSGQSTIGAGESGETTWVSLGNDAFVATYRLDGALVRGRRIGGPGDDRAEATAAVDGDSVIVVGRFEEDASIDAGPSDTVTLSSGGGSDIFVARYDEDGVLLWVVRAGGPGDDEALALAALPDGSFWVAGYFSEQATFGTGTDAVTLESAGAEDIFVARYDASGAPVSARRAGGQFSDRAYGVAVSEAGDVLVTGYFSDVATFFPGTPSETTLTSRGGTDIFVARMPP